MWAPQPGDHWGLAQLSGLVSAGSSQGPDWVGSVALSVRGSQAGPAAGAWGCSPASLWLSREGWSWGVAGRLQVATWAVWGPGPPGCLLLCHSDSALGLLGLPVCQLQPPLGHPSSSYGDDLSSVLGRVLMGSQASL